MYPIDEIIDLILVEIKDDIKIEIIKIKNINKNNF